MKKFKNWLSEKHISTAIKLNEASLPCPTSKTFDAKFGQYREELENMFGPIADEANISQTPGYKGLFFKTGNGQKLSINKKSPAFEAAHSLPNVKLDTNYVYVKFSDDTEIRIAISGSGAVHDANAETQVIDKKFINKVNDWQECIQAIIIERVGKKQGFKTKSKSDIEGGPVYKWIRESDPVKKTNLFAYINVEIPPADIESFWSEFDSTFWVKWSKSMEALAECGIDKKINDVFTSGSLPWNKVEVIHPMKISKTIPASLISNYFSGTRCGKLKDAVDKSDIALVFTKNATKIMTEALSYGASEEDLNAHNTMLNQCIINKEFIGISLKQNTGDVHVSAANLNVKTTAIGEGIKKEKQVFIKYYGPNNSKNTFGSEHEEPASTKEDKSTFQTNVKVQHPEHILLSGNNVKIFYKVMPNKGMAPKFAVSIVGAAAQLGTSIGWLKYFTAQASGKPFDTTKIYNTLRDDGLTPAEAYREISEMIKYNFEKYPGLFEKVIGAAAAYPVLDGSDKKNREQYTIIGTPYFKIY